MPSETLPAFTPVESGHIVGIAHQGDLAYVRFKSGATYRYHGVSPELFQRFGAADSKGQFFNSHIKTCGACERHTESGWTKVERAGREATRARS